ncbi:MAG: sulfatase-like hydrolase/transferase [Candidatus Aminicenantaceae bacterium]
MIKPRSIVFGVLFYLILCPMGVPASDSPDQGKRLNILVITIDTLRSDRLSCYSPDAPPTPVIDGLAKKGALFSRAYAHTTLTLPSHANIMLGTTPLHHGVHTNTTFVVQEHFTTMAEYLKDFGYNTGAFIAGSTLDSRFGLSQGFDVYDDEFKVKGAIKFYEAERPAEQVVGRAIGWLNEVEGPWFLWLHLFDPHFPYEPPEPYLTEFKEQPYDGEVVYTDATIGRLLDFLRKKGADSSTAIVLTSDHGESLGDHGEQTHGILAYNPTLWIPLIIYAPGMSSVQVTQPVAHIDIFPTVCDLLSLELPSFLQGESLIPAVEGRKLAARQIYFESLEPYYNLGWAPLTGFIEGDLKFIETPLPEIYDLAEDFPESRNRVNTLELQTCREKLKRIQKALVYQASSAEGQRLNPNLASSLRSLGYISPRRKVSHRVSFGPDKDAKTLLPMYNRVMEAYRLSEEGQEVEGISRLEGLTRDPQCIDQAYIYLARLLQETGRVHRALDAIKAGLDRFPESYEALRLYSEYLIEAQEFAAVIELLEAENAINMEQDPYVWLHLGTAYLHSRAPQKAIAAFERAIIIDSEYVDALQNLGALHLQRWLTQKKQPDYDRAITLFNRIISIDPEYSGAYTSRGVAYLQWGKTEAAISSWEQAIRIAPEAGKTYYYLGLAYLSQGDKPQAYLNLVKYRDKYYSVLSKEEQTNLDKMIKLARD